MPKQPNIEMEKKNPKIILKTKRCLKRCWKDNLCLETNSFNLSTGLDGTLDKSWIDVDEQFHQNDSDIIPASQTSIEWDSSDEEDKKVNNRPLKRKIVSSKKLASFITPQKEASTLVAEHPSTSPIISQFNQSGHKFSQFKAKVVADNFSSIPKLQLDESSCEQEQLLSPVFKTRRKTTFLKKSKSNALLRNTNSNEKGNNNSSIREPLSKEFSNNNYISEPKSRIQLEDHCRELKDLPSNSLNKLKDTSIIPSLKENEQNLECEININNFKILDESSVLSQESEISHQSTRSGNSMQISQSSPVLTQKKFKNEKVTFVNKGSEWIKALQENTPEKTTNFVNTMDPSIIHSPCPTKVKKNGFAAYFQKLVLSWKSNSNMWNHQIGTIWSEKCLSCTVTQENAITSPGLNLCRRSNSLLRSPFTPLLTVSKGKLFSDTDKEKGHIIKERRSSFDISPAVSNLSSPKTQPKLPQKHMCLKIVQVLKSLSSLSFHLKCLELNICSNSKCDKNSATNSVDLNQRNETSKNYFLILSKLNKENNNSENLQVGDEVKIYAPWQILNVGASTIFASYYTIRSLSLRTDKETNPPVDLSVPLATWTCSCIEENTIPSACRGGFLRVHVNESLHSKENLLEEEKFNCITNSNPEAKEHTRIRTVLQAIEQCGGMPGVPVSITARIIRIYKLRETVDTIERDCYLLLCQDPSGVFFVVQVPDRPLTSVLSGLLEEGTGTTQTLTNLTVTERLTDRQRPALFSLIRSFHRSCDTSISSDCRLSKLISRTVNPQTFCYQFAVTLGQTKHILVVKAEPINFSLPEFKFENTQYMEHDRGWMDVNILYYVHPYLYVTTRSSEKKMERIFVKESAIFPPWMSCSGTILVSAKICDVWKYETGLFCVDKYSSFDKFGEKILISYANILELIPEFSESSQKNDIVIFPAGRISVVHEDDAFSWFECPHCTSCQLQSQVGSKLLTCTGCGGENIKPRKMFSLKVTVMSEQNGSSIIKLFQKTVEGLLQSCLSTGSQRYDASSLLDVQLKPVICCVTSPGLHGSNPQLKEMPF